MARANIIIPDDLLEHIDAAATQDTLSRSGLLQAAARAWLDRRREQREAVARTARMRTAVTEMDRLAETFGKRRARRTR